MLVAFCSMFWLLLFQNCDSNYSCCIPGVSGQHVLSDNLKSFSSSFHSMKACLYFVWQNYECIFPVIVECSQMWLLAHVECGGMKAYTFSFFITCRWHGVTIQNFRIRLCDYMLKLPKLSDIFEKVYSII